MVQRAGIDSTGSEARGQTRELVPGAGKEESAMRNAERQEGMLTQYLVFFPLKKQGPLQ